MALDPHLTVDEQVEALAEVIFHEFQTGMEIYAGAEPGKEIWSKWELIPFEYRLVWRRISSRALMYLVNGGGGVDLPVLTDEQVAARKARIDAESAH